MAKGRCTRRTVFILGNFFAFYVILTFYTNQQTKRFHDKAELEVLENGRNLQTTTYKGFPTETKVYNWSAAALRFKNRYRHLHQTCKVKTHYPQLTQWKPNNNFLVDIPRRLLVCAVQKSGSTSWHRTIWAIRRKRQNFSTDQKLYTSNDTIRNTGIAVHILQKDGNKLLGTRLGDNDFMHSPPTDSSFRLILARHPFARFISGWNQKFLLASNYWVVLMKAYPRLLDYKKKIDRDRVMAFEDFAEYASSHPKIINYVDAHFMPATNLCRICEYDYTYILKAESVENDEPWLKRRLGIEDIDVGRKGSPGGGSVVNGDVKANIKRYMSMLPLNVIKGLFDIYKNDFDYFGYTFNFTTLEAGGFE